MIMDSYQLLPVTKYELLRNSTPRTAEELSNGGIRPGAEEFKLLGLPTTLKEFCDLWRSSDHYMVVWIGDQEDCYVCNQGDLWIPHEFGFQIEWGLEPDSILIISCKTLQVALDCLDNLLDLDDKFYTKSRISFKTSDEGDICPLTCDLLQKLVLQNPRRIYIFFHMTFTPAQCETLASCGTGTSLKLANCRFQDAGDAFRNTYLAPENQFCGPAKLVLDDSAALNDDNLIACLNKLEALELGYLCLSRALSRAVASADLKFLKIISERWNGGNNLGDGGEALVECIREGRGPKKISVCPYIFDSIVTFVRFCCAFRRQDSNAYRDSLEISDIRGSLEYDIFYEQINQPLAVIHGDLELLGIPALFPRFIVSSAQVLLAVLNEDLGLTNFALAGFDTSDTTWSSLIEKISVQSSLRSFSCENVSLDDLTAEAQSARTKEISRMVVAHKCIEEVNIPQELYDEELWKKLVAPALHYHKYRERFAAIGRLGSNRLRGAILVEALARVNELPTLLDILIHENMDTILCAAADREALEPRFNNDSSER